MGEGLISVKETAELLGISTATVNYYTNLGLLQSVEREGNRRLYNKQGIMLRFDTIRKLRKQGYSLALIQQKLHGDLGGKE